MTQHLNSSITLARDIQENMYFMIGTNVQTLEYLRAYLENSNGNSNRNSKKTIQHHVTFVALYSFCFLHLSNLLIHTAKQFDITRHLAREDIIFTSSGAIVIIKWSKTMQNRKDACTIAIPSLGLSEICMVTTLKTDNDQLFRIYKKGTIFTLKDSIACKYLKQISSTLVIQPPLTFHAFRRVASTWVFQHGVSLEHIQAHGTQKSNAVWAYLRTSPPPLLQLLRLLGNIYLISLAPWESHTCLT